jgi:hypothetical protein
MHGVYGSNQKVSATFGKFFRRREHEFGYADPVVGIDALHIVSKVVAVHGHFGMSVRTEQRRTLHADGAIAESGAFRAASDNADVEGHEVSSQKRLRDDWFDCKVDLAGGRKLSRGCGVEQIQEL